MTVFYPNCMIYVIHMITCSKQIVIHILILIVLFALLPPSSYGLMIIQFKPFLLTFRSMIHLNPSVCNMTIACLVNRFHVVHDQNPDLWRNKVRSRLEGCRFSFEIFTPSKNNRYYRMLD